MTRLFAEVGSDDRRDRGRPSPGCQRVYRGTRHGSGCELSLPALKRGRQGCQTKDRSVNVYAIRR